MKVYIRNQQRLIRFNQKTTVNHLRKILQILGLQKAEISILFVNDGRMKILNHLHRGVKKATDVLSFPQLEISNQQLAISNQHIIIGDIVINLHKAKRQAIKYNHSLQKEMDWLLIHGLLHLIGYEHEKGKVDKNKMEEKEKELFDLLYPSSRNCE